MNTLITRLKNMHPKRLAAALLGLGLMAFGLDAGVSHFAAREMKSLTQLIPVIYGAIGGASLAALSWTGSRARFRWLMRVNGAIAMLVGSIGTMMHARPFMMLLEEPGWTLPAIEVALRIAPPLMAPGAFAGIGAVLLTLASPALRVRLERPAPATA